MLRRAALTVAFLGSFVCAATADEATLTETSWLGPDTDVAAFLATAPGECLRLAEDAENQYLVEVGRAAFKSPFLFGGQAARRELSCDSCHRNGHDNPDFLVAGISDTPGTADVTTSMFSKVREDGVFNPVPIPVLLDIGDRASFGSTTPKTSLHDFIGSAVEEEFQGEASSAVIDGLVAYVSHLDRTACPAGQDRRTVSNAINDVRRVLSAAEEAARRDDTETAAFLLVSAQHMLGLMYERYAAADLSDQRAMLEMLSRQSSNVRFLLGGNSAVAVAGISDIQAQLILAETSLSAAEHRSLYDLEQLRRWAGE